MKSSNRSKIINTNRLPRSLTIEIHTYCNTKCDYCPRLTKLKKRMTLDLFKRIIDQYREICDIFKFRGRINFCNDSEPFYDDSVFEYLGIAMKYFEIYFNTNGIGLTRQRLKRLKKSGWNGDMIVHAMPDSRRDLDLIRKYFPQIIAYAKPSLVSRGSLLWPVKQGKVIGCLDNRPNKQMVIRWNGDVSYCCNDFHRKYIVGNVKNGLWHTWKQIGKYPLKFCKKCERADVKK